MISTKEPFVGESTLAPGFKRFWNQERECWAKSLQSCPTLLDTSHGLARQAPLSVGFSRQEYWSGLPCPPPRALPDPGTEPASLYVSCNGKPVLYHQSQKTSRGKTRLNGQLWWIRKGRIRQRVRLRTVEPNCMFSDPGFVSPWANELTCLFWFLSSVKYG